MFVTRIVGPGLITSLSISLIQMLVEHNGFNFESIESSFLLYLDMAFGSWK